MGNERETRIMNKTGCRLVLRSKYKDVWEAARFTLAPGESALVLWAPDKPYERLGAFVDMDMGTLHRLPLLIGQSTLASTKEISFSRSPSHHHFSISMLPRP